MIWKRPASGNIPHRPSEPVKVTVGPGFVFYDLGTVTVEEITSGARSPVHEISAAIK